MKSVREIIPRLTKYQLAYAALVLAVCGGVAYAQVAKVHVKYEAESGTIVGQAAATPDLGASNASYLGFTSSTQPGVQFFEDFTAESGVSRFDYQLHTSGNTPSEHLPIATNFTGEHNTACQGPDTLRTLVGGQAGDKLDVSGSELVWWCAPGNDVAKGHFMTALDTGAVATLTFSPKQIFNNINKVCWEMNMNNLGEGKWMNMFVVPAADVAAKGFHYASGDGGQLDPNEIEMPAGAYSFTWIRGTFKSYQGTGIPADPTTNTSGYDFLLEQWGSYDANMEVTPAPRHPICVEDLNNGTLKYTVFQTANMATSTYTSRGSMPDGQVRVLIQDGSYNPAKHNGTGHNTWHWDNISVQ